MTSALWAEQRVRSYDVDEWRQLRLHQRDGANLHRANIDHDAAGTKMRTNLPQRGRQVADGDGEDHKVTTRDVADVAEPDMIVALVFRGQRGIAGKKREIWMQVRGNQPAEGAKAEYPD